MTTLYQQLYQAFVIGYKEIKDGVKVQRMTAQFWNSIKKDPNCNQLAEKKIDELKKRKHVPPNSISLLFPKRNPHENVSPKQPMNECAHQNEDTPVNTKPKKSSFKVEEPLSVPYVQHHPTPKQDAVMKDIVSCDEQIGRQELTINSRYGTPQDVTKLESLKKKKSQLKKQLKRLQTNSKSQKKSRQTSKEKLSRLQQLHPEENLIKDSPGRRPIEDFQPHLLRTIVEIVHKMDNSTDEKRRSSVLNTVQSLDDLHNALLERNFQLSRTALYHRLLPRKGDSTEGKRHVNTVPVKLAKATNTGRKKHKDSHFAIATVKFLKDLATIMGPGSVFYLSQDDKCRVPIGLPAAKKQAPFLMMMEQRVKLPDHDFVVAKRHKLIPSVYAAAKIHPKIGVTYSGPTYIAIRSGKHDSSTASTHAFDFKSLFKLKEFDEVMKTSEGKLKPIVIISVDGGPDENPRYQSVQSYAIEHFITYDLDAMFVVTHAPGQSAYNIVERRMAPLSHDLAGIILPHEHFGSHLNKSLKCINLELEKKNFQHAGNALSEVWSDTVIDSEPVIAKYIDPDEPKPTVQLQNEKWKAKHVRSSQYLLQIVKCNDKCCKPFRSSIDRVLQDRFLPSPVLFTQREEGPFASTDIELETGRFFSLQQRMCLSSFLPSTEFNSLPFDYYCPSVHHKIKSQVCKKCDVYFCSQKAMKLHTPKCDLDDSMSDSDQETDENTEIDEETEIEDNIDFDEADGDHHIEVPILTIDQITTPFYMKENPSSASVPGPQPLILVLDEDSI